MSERHPTVKEFLSNPTPEIEKNFFARVRLANKTFKTTEANRFDDLNRFTLPWVSSYESPSLMDVAVSSGVSTAEWRSFLTNNGIQCTIVATDYLNEGQYFCFTRHFAFLTDDKRELLHLDFLGYGFAHDLRFHRANFHLLPIKWILVSFFKIFGHSKEPVTIQLTKPLNGLQIVHDDLLAPTPPQWVAAFNVIRAANVLNRGYFRTPQLKTMLQNLFTRLKDGGVLIVSRTIDSKNHASILQKRSGGFSILDRLGNGSEIDGLI